MQTKSQSNEIAMHVTPASYTGCVKINDPFPECYSRNLSSYNIIRIVQYCLGDFKLCEIYCNKVEDKIK